jgi:hypothetical protein
MQNILSALSFHAGNELLLESAGVDSTSQIVLLGFAWTGTTAQEQRWPRRVPLAPWKPDPGVQCRVKMRVSSEWQLPLAAFRPHSVLGIQGVGSSEGAFVPGADEERPPVRVRGVGGDLRASERSIVEL